MFLRQSTNQLIRFGPFVDSTDGVTAETALTIAQGDMMLSKDGGAFAQKNAAGNATHDTDGWYSVNLDPTDTGTAGGELRLQVNVAGALPVWDRWWVLEEDIYDSIFANAAAGFDTNQRVDIGAIFGSGPAANNHQRALNTIVFVTIGTGSTTTNIVCDLSETTDDHYNGRKLFFLTGNLADQATSITDYNGTTNDLTVVALTEAAANGDTALII